MDFGKLISNRRKELGLTLEQVGNHCGVGKSTVRKWETGMIKNVGRDKLALLASVLQLNPVDLIDDGQSFVLSYSSLPARESITTEELILVQAYREAKPEYQNVVLEILSNHKKEE